MGAYEELELNSLHEAGHAVAIVALGGRVDHVTLDYCLEAEDSPIGRWNAAVCCMAGGVAARMLGPRFRSPSREASEKDVALVESHLADLGLDRGEIVRAEKEAKRVMLDHTRATERVAQALRRTGELSGSQVARLFAGESVDAVVAEKAMARGNQAAPVAPAPTHTRAPAAPTSTAMSADGAMRIECSTWALKAGGWCASPGHWPGPPPADRRLAGLEGIGATEDAALDALGEQVARAVGGSVLLVTPEDVAA